MALAKRCNLRTKSVVNLGSLETLFTTISGPHVHKKSRDQYKIERYRGLLVVEAAERRTWETYKKECYANRWKLGFGVGLSFAHQYNDVVTTTISLASRPR